MPWKTVKCDLGHTHDVWCQDRGDACGPSCMIMAYQRIWKKKPNDESLFYEAYNLYGNDNRQVASGASPHRVTNGFEYTFANNLASAMSKFISKSKAQNVGENNVGTKIRSSLLGSGAAKPVIALVNWKDGGGHFVLIDRVSVSNNIYTKELFKYSSSSI